MNGCLSGLSVARQKAFWGTFAFGVALSICSAALAGVDWARDPRTLYTNSHNRTGTGDGPFPAVYSEGGDWSVSKMIAVSAGGNVLVEFPRPIILEQILFPSRGSVSADGSQATASIRRRVTARFDDVTEPTNEFELLSVISEGRSVALPTEPSTASFALHSVHALRFSSGGSAFAFGGTVSAWISIDEFPTIFGRVDSSNGDFDGDGRASSEDLAILKARFGTADPSGEHGDANGDGFVGLTDFGMLKAQYVSTPEPSPLLLAALASAGLLAYRRQGPRSLRPL
jgi:hypothetical protein